MLKIDWVCRSPTHYNNFLFRSLAQSPNIDLTVHFIESSLPSHPWRSNEIEGFRSRVFQKSLGLDPHLLRKAIGDENSFFIIGGWNEPTIMTLINLLILLNRPYAIWTDTPNLNAVRSPLKSKLRQIWLERVFKHARYVMGTGRPALSALEQMNCPKEKLVNFPCFIDLDYYSPAQEISRIGQRDEIVFLSAGRLVNEQKGYDLAIRALAKIKKERPDFRFLYRIAGIGPDREALMRLASENGLEREVEFVGWLELEELPQFYRSGDIFLHPSRFEPFGNVILEAMSCGLVVIGSIEAGAVIDRIEPAVNGFIHSSGNLDDLAEQIKRVIHQRSSLSKISSEARKTAEKWPAGRAVEIILNVAKKTTKAQRSERILEKSF